MVKIRLIPRDLESQILTGLGVALTSGAYLSNNPVDSLLLGSLGVTTALVGIHHVNSFEKLVEKLVSIKENFGFDALVEAVNYTHATNRVVRYIEEHTPIDRLRKAYILHYVEKRVSEAASVSNEQCIWHRIKGALRELYRDESSHCTPSYALALGGIAAGVASTNLRN